MAGYGDRVVSVTYRVVLLRGAPRSGKGTVAGEVARRLGWDVVNSDDVGLVARAVTARSSHPELHYQDDDYPDISNFVERSLRYQRFVAGEAEEVPDLANRVIASISGG